MSIPNFCKAVWWGWNALSPNQVWVLEKDDEGFSNAKLAANYEFVKELVDEGASMGDLWYSRYFG